MPCVRANYRFTEPARVRAAAENHLNRRHRTLNGISDAYRGQRIDSGGRIAGGNPALSGRFGKSRSGRQHDGGRSNECRSFREKSANMTCSCGKSAKAHGCSHSGFTNQVSVREINHDSVPVRHRRGVPSSIRSCLKHDRPVRIPVVSCQQDNSGNLLVEGQPLHSDRCREGRAPAGAIHDPPAIDEVGVPLRIDG